MDKKDNNPADTVERDWPNAVHTRAELDCALEAGEKSGVSPYSVREVSERTISRMKANGKL